MKHDIKTTIMKRELRELVVMLTDAYKLFHRVMYPKNTITVYSNGTPRHAKHYKGKMKDSVVVFGTQRLVRRLHDDFRDFFNLPEEEVLMFCQEQLTSFTGSDYAIEHIRYLHRLQKLPLVVKSLPEGTLCPIQVPYMTFYNTDPKCFWLTNYLETYISCETWALITNATISYEYKQIFDKWALETVGNTNFTVFQGHDFSMRGMFGVSAARASGLAHLTSFCGSDTIPAYLDAQYYYDSGQNHWGDMKIVATSVPASEHSVQCAYFNPEDDNELAYLDGLLDAFPSGFLSIVCDGYDFWKFLTEVVPQRKEQIMAREGKVVFRPDSGNPADIICGLQGKEYYSLIERDGKTLIKSNDTGLTTEVSESEIKGAIEVLWDIFGGTETEKGYRLLDEHVGLIYGDSISLELAEDVCQRLYDKGFASINWIGGIGSYTYQFNTRDSHGQAIKATYVEIWHPDKCELADNTPEGTIMHSCDCEKLEQDKCVEGKAIFKDPKTGGGEKKSAKGLLHVYSDGDRYRLQDEVSWRPDNLSPVAECTGKLQIIYKDGQYENQTDLWEIRERLSNGG